VVAPVYPVIEFASSRGWPRQSQPTRKATIETVWVHPSRWVNRDGLHLGSRLPCPCQAADIRADPSRYEETDRGKPRSVVRTADPWSFHSPGSEGGSTRCSVQTSEYPGTIPRRAPSHRLPHLANAPCVHSLRRRGGGGQPAIELLPHHPHLPLLHFGIVEIDTHAHLPFNSVHGRFQFMGSSLTGPMRGIGRSWRVDGRLRGCTGKRPRN
jgi:hypothetical protein